MRPDALLLDCYGTLVEGDRPVIEAVVADAAHRAGVDPVDVDRPWWERFQALCAAAYGGSFRLQYELEVASLSEVLTGLGAPLRRTELDLVLAPLVDYWKHAQPYDDAVEFLRAWTLCPIVIVSNIDRADIVEVVRRLPPVAAVVTSEDARAYKPHPRVFEAALRTARTIPARTLHVGDSRTSDVDGAQRAGIRAIWLDRSPDDTPTGTERITRLTELATLLGRRTRHPPSGP